MIFAKRLFNAGHIREFLVDQAQNDGWEIREAEDNRIVRRSRLHDWHRVEGVMMRFGLEAMQLERNGWVELQTKASRVV